MYRSTLLSRLFVASLACAAVGFAGCDDDDTDPPTADMGVVDGINVAPAAAQTVAIGATTAYTVSGLTDGQAYRVTLVVADNVQTTAGAGIFVDGDANGAADAGASENVALITMVNGAATMPGAKTVPGGMDDPAAPSGIFPVNGEITLEITGVGPGAIHPVAYVNGGASTFLEINDAGAPIEPHAVGGMLTVEGADGIVVAPTADQTIAANESADYTISGLADGQAYRVTLVVGANLTAGGDGTGTFVDNDMNGAADAGASENVALITTVNGMDMAGAKTVPGGMDDPMAPSGIFAADGQITLTVTGVGAGTIYPVAYANGGASTFLEIDGAGSPTETYAVGGALTVAAPALAVDPADETVLDAGQTVEYTVSGLSDTQAYRVTLVVADNVTAVNGAGTFVDNDMNGAADAGASENVALITTVNGMDMPGAKTVPGGMDDPMAPSGVFPVDGQIKLVVTGVGAGTIYPVAYTNQGASTFLEIDGAGTPIEPHVVGGALTVNPPPAPMVAPADMVMSRVSGETEYTITGLNDAQAYRVTLVVGANVTPGAGGTATFVDNDMNGAADAGPSETVALITTVNGTAMPGAKTVPGGMDDPMAPSGIFPVDGAITLIVTGVGEGTIYPVAYENGGASTFLEIGEDGAPVENYGVGGALTVTGFGYQPTGEQTIANDGSVDYVINGLMDAQAYRITLVVDANVTLNADGTATFVDNDMNGAADAGASENVALITTVGGLPVVPGAKTVPSPLDIPLDPSGIYPVGGRITLTVAGVGAGAVRPVVYTNAGESTFLEIGEDGLPIEPYHAGGLLTVTE